VLKLSIHFIVSLMYHYFSTVNHNPVPGAGDKKKSSAVAGGIGSRKFADQLFEWSDDLEDFAGWSFQTASMV
jgi:hypothetical protein